MYAKELKSANGRKPGKSKDTSTPHCIYNTDPFQVGPVSDTDMLSKMTIELPKFYKPPPIEDCVNDYNLPKSAELMKSVNAISERIVKESAADSLNRENVKCLSLYTFDPKPPSKGLIGTITGGGSSSNSNSSSKGDSEASARGRLNEMLRTRNPFMVVKNRGYLVSFLTALRKLPKTEKFAFYVGVREKIANASKFKYGSLVSCKFFLSSSTDPDSIKEMLDYTGTLFIIRGDPWAYDIRPFSFYPNEQEYLFEFGSQFKVTKVINGPINTIEMSINKTQNYDLTALVPIPGYVPPSPASSSSSSSSSSSLSSQQQVPSHTQSDLGNAQAQGAKSLAPMASVACLTPHSNVVVAPNVPNHHQQSPSAVTATPANQNTLVASKERKKK